MAFVGRLQGVVLGLKCGASSSILCIKPAGLRLRGLGKGRLMGNRGQMGPLCAFRKRLRTAILERSGANIGFLTAS